MILFQNGKILEETENGFCLRKADMQIEGDRIVAIGENLSGGEAVDCAGKILVPGLFDIHTHGAVGFDHSKCDADGIQAVADFEAKHGVTSFLPTVMTAPVDWLDEAVKTIGDYAAGEHSGAKVEGIHMEGPYFSLKKCGAQPPEWIIPPSAEQIREWNRLSGGIVREISVAPEVDGAMEFIHELKDEYVLSLAHTAADYETAAKALREGACHATHLYNGMTGMTHREPGVVGAVWDDPNATAELIGDGHHVHPAVVRITFTILGKRVILISDSLLATGAEADTEMKDLAGRPVSVRNGLARLEDGTIAGAGIPLSEDVRRVVGFGVPIEDAYYAASYAPAKRFGLENEIGGLRAGKRADFSLVDEELQIQQVWVRGKAIQ